MPARYFHWMQLTMSTVSNALLGEQQAMIRESARRVAQEVVAPTAAQRDQASQWPRAEIEAAAGASFMGMLIPRSTADRGSAPSNTAWRWRSSPRPTAASRR